MHFYIMYQAKLVTYKCIAKNKIQPIKSTADVHLYMPLSILLSDTYLISNCTFVNLTASLLGTKKSKEKNYTEDI